MFFGRPPNEGSGALSRLVDVGADFEVHRAAVESVSVLFDLFDGDAADYMAGGSPGEKLPTGWMVTAAKFEVEWPRWVWSSRNWFTRQPVSVVS